MTTRASVDALTEAFGALRAALDTRDAAAIMAASKAVRTACDDVRAQGAWRLDPAVRAKLEALVPMIEAARVRVNLASDDVRQRIAMLAQHGVETAAATYTR